MTAYSCTSLGSLNPSLFHFVCLMVQSVASRSYGSQAPTMACARVTLTFFWPICLFATHMSKVSYAEGGAYCVHPASARSGTQKSLPFIIPPDWSPSDCRLVELTARTG